MGDCEELLYFAKISGVPEKVLFKLFSALAGLKLDELTTKTANDLTDVYAFNLCSA